MGQLGSERLVLHGLWPTFSTETDYQSWPQFCSTKTFDGAKCHINGNLCPWANASKNAFTQDDYEFCLSIEQIDECLINGTEILRPFEEQLKIFAPGYLNERNLFINHEWTKHGVSIRRFSSIEKKHNSTIFLQVRVVRRVLETTFQHI